MSSLSIFDIAKNISWTKEKRIYLTQKDSKYELLIEYLSSGSIENLEQDIKILKEFQLILNSNNKIRIEDFIMIKLEGFTQHADGVFAHIAGAHDLSPAIHYS